METLALGAMAAGTAMSISGQLQQGKAAEQEGRDMQKLANVRAEIARQNAEAARTQSVEKAKILAERKTKLLASQKAAFAAGNVMINIDSPLVLAAETERDVAKDIGFVLEEGRVERDLLLSEAAYETAYGSLMAKKGKAARKQSMWGALGTGLKGFGSMAYMGYQGGYWGGGKTGGVGVGST